METTKGEIYFIREMEASQFTSVLLIRFDIKRSMA